MGVERLKSRTRMRVACLGDPLPQVGAQNIVEELVLHAEITVTSVLWHFSFHGFLHL